MRARLAAVLLALFSAGAAAEPPVAWQAWSPKVFQQAQRQHRLVFLYLGATWCHACHVMDNATFADPAVRAELRRHYVAVRVDHDANPGLANRYRDWGWPALVFLAADGEELVKRAGYLGSEPFRRLLQAVARDPTAEEAEASEEEDATGARAATEGLAEAQRAELEQRHDDSYDPVLGGLKLPLKFLDRDSVEYALALGANGDAEEAHKARQTLDAARALLDPVWGGFYQYSTEGDWHHPHFEKIMRVQAGALRTYALAYAQSQRPEDLKTALAVRDFLRDFLQDRSGAFYVSQDADLVPGRSAERYFALPDAARRAQGMPRIDRSLYAQENGWAAEALATLSEASGDALALQMATQAANWALQNRALRGGGFRHGAHDRSGPYLGDTLAMARACLALYRVTAERPWLHCAEAGANFAIEHFRDEDGGFRSAAPDRTPVAPEPDLDENISAARFFNLLSYYTGDAGLRGAAAHAMRYLADPQLVSSRVEEAGILLADDELATDPPHFTVVGAKNDPAARALYQAALRTPGWYQRVEWWDPKEGPLPNNDVPFPSQGRAAGYVCTGGRCSAPSFEPATYRLRIEALAGS